MSACICRGFSHDPKCPMTPRPEADAPADTTLRVQIARWLCEYRFGSNAWEKASDVRRSMALSSADALLPLLRAHDAQVAAQARQDALNKAADALEGRLGVEGAPRHIWEFRKWLRDRAEQDTPDQANT